MIHASAPLLPCLDLEETIAFYVRLGFTETHSGHSPDPYAILKRDSAEIHLFGMAGLEPSQCYAGGYLRVDGIDALRQEMSRSGLPLHGTPRLSTVMATPWGMREFHLVDLNGNLLRFGEPLPGKEQITA